MLTEEQKKVVNDLLDTINYLEQQNKKLVDALSEMREAIEEVGLDDYMKWVDGVLQQIQGERSKRYEL